MIIGSRCSYGGGLLRQSRVGIDWRQGARRTQEAQNTCYMNFPRRHGERL